MNKCKCGCGEFVIKNYKKGHGRRGRKNTADHNEKIGKSNKGKIVREESIQKCLQTKKERYGDENGKLHVSKEIRLKISKTAKEKGVGKWMKGRTLSEETKNKLSEVRKGYITSQETKHKIGLANNGNKNGMYGKCHKDFMTDEEHSEFLKKLSFSAKQRWINLSDDDREKWINRLRKYRKYMILPVKDTKIEVKIREFLEKLSVSFVQHKYIQDIKHGYQCDFFLGDFNLIIECDGDYWHNYPNYRPIDLLRTSEMKFQGYKVLRMWERDIHKLTLREFEIILNDII